MKRYGILFVLIGLVAVLWAVIWPLSYEYASNGFGLFIRGTINRGIEFNSQNTQITLHLMEKLFSNAVNQHC